VSGGGTRIAGRFQALKRDRRAGLIAFVTAGDPDAATAAAILAGLPAAGADLIELGMPFSDPMADGPAIQASSQRALAAGQTMKKTLSMVGEFRRRDADTPIILMGYYNPIYIYGVDAFVNDAAGAGVDGLIVVDLPPEEDEELRLPAAGAGLDFIRLATPTSDAARLPRLMETASGFVYYVSVTGITGTKSAAIDGVAEAVGRIRARSPLPIAVGFGIKTAEQAAAVARVADAAVVGSAIVEIIRKGLEAGNEPVTDLPDSVLDFVSQLSQGVRSARTGSVKEAASS
jgi:tryptophan synthase alpha chain